MTPLIIGIASGIFVILLFHLLKQFDKTLVYALILTGIGFIYVGFTWTNLQALVVCCIQAVFFLMVAYFGALKGLYLIGLGYFLHGSWDIIYAFFSPPGLIPPGYDLFCLSIDFTMGAYLLYLAYRGHKATLELSVKN
jgi:hypothetical protein